MKDKGTLPASHPAAQHKHRYMAKRLLSGLGPGIVTGAADDDPSGIATYSIAGAQQGLTLLWMPWLTWPLMASVQMMCARIGLVTGHGLSSALRLKLPIALVRLFCFALFIANTINIAADFAAMADAAQLLTGLKSHYFVMPFGLGISYVIVKYHYRQIENVLKWLALMLLAYVVTAFIIQPDWSRVAEEAFTFTFPQDTQTWETIVAVVGTTISPYLFFWQTSQEVEEHTGFGAQKIHRQKVTNFELLDKMLDIGLGTFLTNIIMFFIILTTALTLNKHGIVNLTSSKDVAEALRPLAGDFAYLLYTIGILALGFLAIPTLAGSAAYSFAETFNWPEGLNKKFGKAKAFYGVIFVSIMGAVGLDFIHINPIKALFWAAVVNGVLAPFLLVGIVLVARDPQIMNGQHSSVLNQTMVILTTLLMFAAALAMFFL